MKYVQDKLLFPDILWDRPLNIYKRALGKALIIAGSEGMAGAAALALEASMRSGVGIATLAYPGSLKNVYKKLMPEGMSLALPVTPSGSLSLRGKNQIVEESKNYDVIAIGPGLSRNAETIQLCWELFFEIKKPLIVDADALNALSLGSELIKERGGRAQDVLGYLKTRKEPTVITPHAGEMLRIVKAIRQKGEYLKITSDYIDKNKKEIAEYVAKKTGFIVVMKGYETVLADRTNLLFNKTGNPGMATAGSGDVLVGIISCFVAQNLNNIFEATATAIYLHGLAGDLAADKLGQRSMVASDIIKNLPQAIKKAEKEV